MNRLFKFFSHNWFLFYGIIVIILFVAKEYVAGILMILIGVFLGIFIMFFKRKNKAALSRNLLGIEKISERELARIAGVYIEDAHSFLHDVSRNPDSSGIPILVKGEYIYFSNKVIKEFKKLYKDGKNTKDILEAIPQFETREEVKKMIEKLKEFEELPERQKKEV
nr:hypothetical protein [Candidatus Sigynarchaeota archaeon]